MVLIEKKINWALNSIKKINQNFRKNRILLSGLNFEVIIKELLSR
jgi:hypothetical protein